METEKMEVLFTFKYGDIEFNISSLIKRLPINIGHKIIPIGFVPEYVIDQLKSIGEIEKGIVRSRGRNGYPNYYFQIIEMEHIITEIKWLEDFVVIECSSGMITIENKDLFWDKMNIPGIDF